MDKRRIRVTKKDIADSVPKNSERCMIAQALLREIPDAKYISVDVATVRYSDLKTGRRHVYLTPPIAQRALLQFDKGKPVDSFRFTLANGFDTTMRTRRTDGRKVERTAEWLERKKKQPKRYAAKKFMPSRERNYGVRSLPAE
jgi:hypothetical protein